MATLRQCQKLRGKRERERNTSWGVCVCMRPFRRRGIRICDNVLCLRMIVAELPHSVAESDVVQQMNRLGLIEINA